MHPALDANVHALGAHSNDLGDDTRQQTSLGELSHDLFTAVAHTDNAYTPAWLGIGQNLPGFREDASRFRRDGIAMWIQIRLPQC